MQQKLELLIVKRFFWNKKALSTRSSLFALGGLALGVAVLYVSLAVMSGFEKTLQQSLTDVTGHLTVIKRSSEQEPWKKFVQRLRDMDSRVVTGTPFMKVEGVVAASGKVQGVLIEGLDDSSYRNVLRLDSRLTEGSLEMTPGKKGEFPRVLIGKILASRLGKTVGDTIHVVVPRFGDLETSGFRRTMGTFQIAGLLDLGKYEWNERLIAADIREVQKLADIHQPYSGLLVRLQSAEQADDVSSELVAKLGRLYWIKDWRADHENIFEAIQLERRVIFFVVFILVIVASFAVASNLLLQSLQKTSDVAVLKSMGLTARRIRRIFIVQGLFIGLTGVFLGMGSGFIVSILLNLYQKKWGLISASVYKIDHIDLSVRWQDLLWILSTTLFICWIVSLIPAWRAGRRQPAEGLRYE